MFTCVVKIFGCDGAVVWFWMEWLGLELEEEQDLSFLPADGGKGLVGKVNALSYVGKGGTSSSFKGLA